jgi:16S rRNA (guanine527-N7)-methyltransferase
VRAALKCAVLAARWRGLFSKVAIARAIDGVLTAFGRRSDEPSAGSTLGARLSVWAERVVAWNQRIDLTAARSVEELVDLLLADAAAIAQVLPADAPRSCVDIGSGAGAPGLALALLVPSLAVTLVEPKTKRVAFLRGTVGLLTPSAIAVERARSDELPEKAWDLAISRATFEPAIWRDEGARLAREEVWVLLAQQEPPSGDSFQVTHELQYTWPLTGIRRRAIAFQRRVEVLR